MACCGTLTPGVGAFGSGARGPGRRCARVGLKTLFVHEWQPARTRWPHGDGLGPVFTIRSCVAATSRGAWEAGGARRRTCWPSRRSRPEPPRREMRLIHGLRRGARFRSGPAGPSSPLSRPCKGVEVLGDLLHERRDSTRSHTRDQFDPHCRGAWIDRNPTREGR